MWKTAGCPAMLTYGKRSHIYILSCVVLIVIAYRHYKLHQSLFDRHTTEGKEYGLKKMFGIKRNILSCRY